MVLRRPRTVHHRVEPVLGTRLDLHLGTTSDRRAGRALDAVLAEIDRLERILSVFDPASELARWKRGELDRIGPELTAVLCDAAALMTATGGLFHPNLRTVTDRWKRAETEGIEPTAGELHELLDDAAVLPYRCADGRIERTGPAIGLDLNAYAKGWIVDAAAGAAMRVDGIDSVVVNLGGEVAHRGHGGVVVAVEDPFRRAANAAPIAACRISGQASATSGSSWRGFTIAGQRLGHVIDPRDGRPVGRIASATVVAPTVAEADGWATVLAILPPEEGLAAVAPRPAFVVDSERRTWSNPAWEAISAPPAP